MQKINLVGSSLVSLSADAKSLEDLARHGATIRYALRETPRGKDLFTYFLAILTILGAFTEDRNEFKVSSCTRFFKSRSAITHHTSKGNLQSTRPGYARLTETGYRYFTGRVKGQIKGQEVDARDLAFYTAVAYMGMHAKNMKHAIQDGRFHGLRDSDLRAIDIG
jgi:hypothetical protein